jgi:multiple sugar transport system permease protein
MILATGGIFMMLPIIWMVLNSFKPPAEISQWPPTFLPAAPTLQNYVGLFDAAPFALFFANSVGISIVSTLAILITSVVAGAIFAKYEFPGKKLLFIIIIATAIVPFESYMVPLYLQMVSIGWVNTYQGIVVPYLIMSFGIFLLRQHIASAIPTEYLEAARVDGASEWWILVRIILPLCASALAALGIFAFIGAWAIFVWPLMVANDTQLFNMELGLTVFQFRFSTDYGKLMAGSVISVTPMLVVFLLLRQRIIDSVAMTGLKG